MILRPPKIADFDLLLKINDSAHPNPWSPKAIRSELDLIAADGAYERGNWGFVVEIASETVGYLFSRRQGHDFVLMVIGVAKGHQRRGVGRLLMNALLAEVLSYLTSQVLGNAEIFLEVSEQNKAALRLYAAFGFIEFNRRKNYYSDGSDGLCLKLKVANP